AVSAYRQAAAPHALRGRNGETGLNPWRCLVKLDALGCVGIDVRISTHTVTSAFDGQVNADPAALLT
ncbi:hypothetical protein AB0H42_31130, partial [Nocardia sp. NPDC050799]|uniref:hypothetical protein n=1 Tax=Nocardia sp. NPDC050799 TaxID=3154842 RepID=UPI0033E0859E